MSQSLNTAASGLRTQQRSIDTLANNIANVNTPGFKRSRLDFADAIYAAMQNPALPADRQDPAMQLGHGVLPGMEITDWRAGPLMESGRQLDVAIDSPAFLMTEDPNGKRTFVRGGSLQSMSENDSYVLMTTGGHYVLDQNGQRIYADQSFENMSVDTTGLIRIDGADIARLGVVTFANPDGLIRSGQGAFQVSASSGAPAASRSTVRQGFVEASNVDPGEEMTRLIQAQRAYAFLSRAVTTSDQMRATENEIRR